MPKDSLLTLIGGKVKKKRISKNLTQMKVSEDAGLDLSYYTNFENGHKNISIKNLIKIAIILDTELVEFIPSKSEILNTHIILPITKNS